MKRLAWIRSLWCIAMLVCCTAGLSRAGESVDTSSDNAIDVEERQQKLAEQEKRPTELKSETIEQKQVVSDIRVRFHARDFDGLGESILAAIESLPSHDKNRVFLANMLANLGGKWPEKAATLMESWKGNYRDISDEQLRFRLLGGIYERLLHKPDRALELYEEALEAHPDGLDPALPFTVFLTYSNNRSVHQTAMMEAYLDKINGELPVRRLASAYVAAESGLRKKALSDLDEYKVAIGGARPSRGEATDLSAPVWGWLGDAERVVALLEPYLKNTAAMYSPEGFALLCEWYRNIPAYDSIRDNKVFTDMWDRLKTFEPKPSAMPSRPGSGVPSSVSKYEYKHGRWNLRVTPRKR